MTEKAEKIAALVLAINRSMQLNRNLSELVLLSVAEWSTQPYLMNLDPIEQEQEFNKWATAWQTKEFGKPLVINRQMQLNKTLTERVLLSAAEWSTQPHLMNLSPIEQEQEFNKWATAWQTKELGKPLAELVKEYGSKMSAITEQSPPLPILLIPAETSAEYDEIEEFFRISDYHRDACKHFMGVALDEQLRHLLCPGNGRHVSAKQFVKYYSRLRESQWKTLKDQSEALSAQLKKIQLRL
jgi:hypothetical protein